MAKTRRFKHIYDLDSEMYRPPYLNIYHTRSYEEDIENKSLRIILRSRYLEWTNSSVLQSPLEAYLCLTRRLRDGKGWGDP